MVQLMTIDREEWVGILDFDQPLPSALARALAGLAADALARAAS